MVFGLSLAAVALAQSDRVAIRLTALTASLGAAARRAA
jgi:hypothetical protein